MIINKCKGIYGLKEMGREIRLIIPEEESDCPITLGNYIIRKKDCVGFYLSVDDGENILQLRIDGNKNLISCYIHNCINEINLTPFAKNMNKDERIVIVNK